ncbi:hypothetical protein BJ322DRAFT_1074853 [Thelephora terrestris]|uniref:VWFA domain-containing protein n=1 Tax=Thelephora terrestris TaxID=56493 RepID=A0A9P6H946_9AGAM|nr:hypothetical protein BJ322DRAFT_1074853 [Thelephora terrestris]
MSPAQPRNSKSSSEDVLQYLVNYDVIILMDDSGSMSLFNGSSKSLWDRAMEVMQKVTEVAMKYDTDGIEIQFLNSNEGRTVKSMEDVRSLFKQVKPSCMTPLGKRLDEICGAHLDKLKTSQPPPKRCLIIAITDGEPTDAPRVKSTIQRTANELHESRTPLTQLGIQFVQIGNCVAATKFLKELDDEFEKRDIVDTVPYDGVDLTPEQMVKILVGAINRRVDNEK